MVEQLVAVLGRGVLSPSDSPEVITADDVGFTRGDGVFDATRVQTSASGASTVDYLDEHLARFARSIAGLDGAPPDEQQWRDLIAQAVTAWTIPGEAILKIMWSRGQESSSGSPTQVATITALSESAKALREGIAVTFLGRGSSSDAYRNAPWLLGGVKTLSYGVNVAVKREAARRGCDEVVFTSSDGFVLEGPNSALITLHQATNRQLSDTPVLRSTPIDGTGVLRSITQTTIWQRAHAEGVTTELVLQTPAEVLAADAAWLVSSVRGAAPVTRIDDHALPLSPEWTSRLRGWIGF